MNKEILPGIHTPSDLKPLKLRAMKRLAQEIRTFLIENVSRSGGHLGPNLGAVELTLAIHRVFDSPHDAIVFDTGHQSYVHKLVTGRQDFSLLRERGGLAGYPQRSESEHDIVESSHASSSLSWADGISRAWKIAGEHDRTVVAVVGDGSLTGGMTWEALNNISDDNSRRMVIVVNDNGRSYAPTIGGVARFLNRVRTDQTYTALQRRSGEAFSRIGGRLGRSIFRAVRGGMHGFLARFSNVDQLYSNLDIKYLGPIDGHDQAALEEALRQAKRHPGPVIVHAITEKGHGFRPATEDANDQFHAVGQIDPITGEPLAASNGKSWTSVFGEEMVTLAGEREDIVGVTAAMLRPVGLAPMKAAYPDRVLDVGIAEQHAVTSAAGMAYGGLHPVVAIYSTFMNRAFDQVLMDVGLHHAPVTFVLDRAGVTGPDGPSHHGMWDLALLQVIPGIRLAAPRDATRLREELREAVEVEDSPTVLRYSKGQVGAEIEAVSRLEDGVDVLKIGSSSDVLIVAVGSMAAIAVEVANFVEVQGIGVTVVDPRWVVPVPESVIELARHHRLVISIEDGVKVGGIGTRIRQDLRAAEVDATVTELGLPDEFIDHASREQILEDAGLTSRKIGRDIVAQVLGSRVPHARPERETGEPLATAEIIQSLRSN
ncbi:MAG: 1-deoxy-D-xylulose-5-phosphate synthase [Gulosibacter sp.]|uniref:1-deoxy-D-xylulose-5-phosphate synthase n=1 Tax=Gulosibacter sp. TaxID=2817531 RepID=UPI003F8FEA0E